jgi:hypothetical protein
VDGAGSILVDVQDTRHDDRGRIDAIVENVLTHGEAAASEEEFVATATELRMLAKHR